MPAICVRCADRVVALEPLVEGVAVRLEVLDEFRARQQAAVEDLQMESVDVGAVDLLKPGRERALACGRGPVELLVRTVALDDAACAHEPVARQPGQHGVEVAPGGPPDVTDALRSRLRQVVPRALPFHGQQGKHGSLGQGERLSLGRNSPHWTIRRRDRPPVRPGR